MTWRGITWKAAQNRGAARWSPASSRMCRCRAAPCTWNSHLRPAAHPSRLPPGRRGRRHRATGGCCPGRGRAGDPARAACWPRAALARAPVQLWAAARPRKDLTARRWARWRNDIGAVVSAREKAAVVPAESYFQFQDSIQHSKIIERRLIATVGDYLRELGVDTSEFWERVAAILNTGVINAGRGTMNISGSAVGQQPTVTSQAVSPQP